MSNHSSEISLFDKVIDAHNRVMVGHLYYHYRNKSL